MGISIPPFLSDKKIEIEKIEGSSDYQAEEHYSIAG
jgi:hypothetical protein